VRLLELQGLQKKYYQRPESAVTKGFVEAKKTVDKVDKSSEKADQSAYEDQKGYV
jgi:hypothetical protein